VGLLYEKRCADSSTLFAHWQGVLGDQRAVEDSNAATSTYIASSRPPNEAITRRDQIDPQLQRAGWNIADSDQVGIEIPVDGYDPAAWHVFAAQLNRAGVAQPVNAADLPSGICDYALYRANGEIIAVVEAKKAGYDPRLAQATFYVHEIGKRQNFQPETVQ
jgi:type I site-specific restriction endonuclease